MKKIITEAPILSYYNRDKESIIHSYANLKGLGCVLVQDGKPVCYTSRSLTDAVSRYCDIERELLAACWSMEKIYHYIYGKQVVVETDHKSLQSIWKKSISCASPRLQRLLLKMTKYEVYIKYIPGETNVVADALSRVSQMELPAVDSEIPVIEVDTITSTLPATLAKLEDIRKYADQDPVYIQFKHMVYHGWLKYVSECSPDIMEYWNFREDLNVEDGLIHQDTSTCSPTQTPIANAGHHSAGASRIAEMYPQGQDCLYWPAIYNDIKEMTARCQTCI